MSGILYFEVKSISLSRCGKSPPSTLRVAARHNKREIQAELGADGRIDPSRTHLNQSLAGPATAADVVELATSTMQAAGVDVAGLRKDYTQAVELMFSLPPGFADDSDVFRCCVDWAARRLGVVCILSADIHRDESAPHCHVLTLPPIDGGKMRGSDAVALARSAAMRQSLGREVARKFGLTMGAGKLAGKRKSAAVAMALERMEAAIAPAAGPALWRAIENAVRRDPGPYIDALGIDAPAREMKTSTAIFTSLGKGPRKERSTQSPMGFAAGAGGRMPRHDDCGESPLGFDDGGPVQDAGGESPLGFTGAVGPEKSDGQKAKPILCMGFDDKQAFPDGCHAPAEVLPNSVRDPDDVGQAGDMPGDWVREHDGDEGPGDVVFRIPDDAGVPSVGDGEREQVRCRKRPVRVAGALPVPCGVHREGVAGEGDGVERVREDGLDSGCWDSDTGEFMQGGGP